jgi:Cleft lip and palate transmembrane protein 1 (CLPTM1)
MSCECSGDEELAPMSHTIPRISRFEMLAFKSDVSHWREKKEMVGVSVR